MILFIFHHFYKRWNLEQDYVVLQFYNREASLVRHAFSRVFANGCDYSSKW